MPPVRAVRSLYDLVGDRTWKLLLQAALSTTNANVLIRFRNFIKNYLNANIRQYLVNKVLATHMYEFDLSNKCFMLELLADRTLKIVDLVQKDKNNVLFINEVFQLYRTLVMSNLMQLEKLCLVCSIKAKQEEIYITDVNNTLFRGLKQMSLLRHLTVTSIVDSEFLEILSSTCHLLEHLDVSESVRVTDEGIACLLVKNSDSFHSVDLKYIMNTNWVKSQCCSSLKFLGLHGTEITNYGISLCLLLVPNLRSFGGYISGGRVADCISLLRRDTFALTNLWDSVLSEKEAEFIHSCCPSLTSIVTESINSLECFKSLSSLIIDADFKNVEDEILDLLYSIGNSLILFELRDSINTCIDLDSLVEVVPNLKRLDIPLKCIEKNRLESKFLNLSRASVVVSSSDCFTQFLYMCPSIENLEIKFVGAPYCETSDSITDNLLISALGDGCLRELQSFSIESCFLGDEGLQALLEYCPKLNHVEKLFYWRNVTKSFVEEVERRTIANNWKLDLVIKERWCDMKLDH